MSGVGVRQVGRGAMAAALAVPAIAMAQASAATIAPVFPCFVNSSPTHPANIGIIGSGFTPGDDIDISGEGVFDHSAAAANGGVGFITEGPTLPTIDPGYRTYTITASDATAGSGPIAVTQIRVANFAFTTSPSYAKLSATVRWSFSGFPTGRELYAHFTRRGRQVGALRFGRAQGPCGVRSVRARFFPLSRAPQGTYGVQVDTARRYSRRAVPRITSKLTTYL